MTMTTQADATPLMTPDLKAKVAELTAEQIEAWRDTWNTETYPGDIPEYAEARNQLNALCDMALRSTEQVGGMAEALDAFMSKGGYLEHPDVRPYNGTLNGDSIDAWKHDYCVAAVRAMLSAHRRDSATSPATQGATAAQGKP